LTAEDGHRTGDSMAHILEFRSNAVRAEIDCEPAVQGSAQIIIFPGVRIERHAEPETEPCAELQVESPVRTRKRDRARAKRDRLELLD
jgi:hypothetical protein